MQKIRSARKLVAVLALAVGSQLFPFQPLMAHCDTVDGPVVSAARRALAEGEVTSALKWVKPDHEGSVEAAFEQALAVRQLGEDARRLADQYFYEILVRLHREGEGFGFKGLKPTGSPVSAAVLGADAALESGSVDALVDEITEAIAEGVRKRFAHARETRAHAEESIAAGREFVAAYVELTHYVEGLEAVAGGHLVGHAAPAGHEPGVTP